MDDRQIAQIVSDLAEEIEELKVKGRTKASPFNLEKHGLEPGSVSALFDPRMAFELAVGVFDPVDIALRYELTQEQFKVITESSGFQKVLAAYQMEIEEKGISVRLKAKLQLNHLLGVAFDMATDPLVPANVRADLIKWHADLADEMPKKQVINADTIQPGTNFTYALHITMTGEESKGKVYDGESRVVAETKRVETEEKVFEVPLVFAGVPEDERAKHADVEPTSEVLPEVKQVSDVEDILRRLEQHNAEERAKFEEKKAAEAEALFSPAAAEPVAVPAAPTGFDYDTDAIKRRAQKMARQLQRKTGVGKAFNSKFKATDDSF